MEVRDQDVSAIQQYSLNEILIIWAAAAIPMGILGWIVAPALQRDGQNPGFERLAVLTVGLVWQFLLTVFLLYREAHSLHWPSLRHRLWLNQPRSATTGEARSGLWWWLVPVILLTAMYQLQVSPAANRLWVSIFPLLAEPSGFSFGDAFAAPEVRSQLEGAWGRLGLFLLSALFNTVLGEELLFRGLLLPRMAGVFGSGDWVMNGLLFGAYHLHQPWGIASSTITGIFLFALPSRYFRSSWFGVIAHSGQSVFFAVLLLGLVLGLR